jgi:ATP-dependent Clp protease ATP-binding subunit ClpA
MSRRTAFRPEPIAGRMLALARAEAERARHGYVGCEHLLLALLSDSDGVAGATLSEHGIALPSARAAVDHVISDGRGDGPRWNQADLLATLGVDLPGIQRRLHADFGPHAVDQLYAAPIARRLSRGPLCGLSISPQLKQTLAAGARGASHGRDGGEQLLSALLDSGSAGLGAVLDALGTSAPRLRAAPTAPGP